MNRPPKKIALPFWLESLALLIIPFEETLSLSIGSVLRIVNLLVLFTGIVFAVSRGKKAEIRSSTARLCLFYVFMVSSVIWCKYFGLYFDRLSTYSLGVALIVVLQMLEPNESEQDLLVSALWLGGVAVSLMILYSGSATISIGGRETIVLFGRQVDPNYLSFSIVISSAINFYYLVSREYKVFVKIVLGFLQFVLASTIIALGSRGAFLSTAVVLACMVLNTQYKRNAWLKKSILVICALAVASVFYMSILETGGEMSRFTVDNLLGKGVYGTAKRADIWAHAIEQFQKRPLLGYGLGSAPSAIAEVYRYVGTHNSYLMILLEFGIIGFILFCNWQIPWIWNLYHRPNRIYFFMELAVLCFIMFIEGFPTKAFWGVHIVMFVGSCRSRYSSDSTEEYLCKI